MKRFDNYLTTTQNRSRVDSAISKTTQLLIKKSVNFEFIEQYKIPHTNIPEIKKLDVLTKQLPDNTKIISSLDIVSVAIIPPPANGQT